MAEKKKDKQDPREAQAVGATIDDTTVSGGEAALHGHYVVVEKGDHKDERAVVIGAKTNDKGEVTDVVLRRDDAPLAQFTVPYKDVRRES